MQDGNQYVVFKTATLLDLRAITTFGLNAKPNTKSPIGFFGTGLKMAIAVLIRNKVPIRLFIGDTEYEFKEFPGDFRDVGYTGILMRKKTSLMKMFIQTQLPFTTELAKNWTLWQAFRELESNTRDELGQSSVHSFLGNDIPVLSDPMEPHVHTTIIVGPSEEFAKVYEERDKIFLPEALQTFDWGDKELQIFKQPSNYIYYRGIRVLDLAKPSIFTYNIVAPTELTEDRTIKYEWDVRDKVQRFLAAQEDRGLINQLLNATDDHWESGLTWDSEYATKPSAIFLDTLANKVAKAKGKENVVHPRFVSYHGYASPPPSIPKQREWVKLRTWFNKVEHKLDAQETQELMDIMNELEKADI
jgi:hypothetical protein